MEAGYGEGILLRCLGRIDVKYRQLRSVFR